MVVCKPLLLGRVDRMMRVEWLSVMKEMQPSKNAAVGNYYIRALRYIVDTTGTYNPSKDFL